jgi:tRNA A22 N-methylase
MERATLLKSSVKAVLQKYKLLKTKGRRKLRSQLSSNMLSLEADLVVGEEKKYYLLNLMARKGPQTDTPFFCMH